MRRADRLFVPLTAEAFGWWRSGVKEWEIRRHNKRWGFKHVHHGRRVELRLGYSGPSLWGTVHGHVTGLADAVLMADSLDELIPGCPTEPAEAMAFIARATGPVDLLDLLLLVAFRVDLDPGQGVGE